MLRSQICKAKLGSMSITNRRLLSTPGRAQPVLTYQTKLDQFQQRLTTKLTMSTRGRDSGPRRYAYNKGTYRGRPYTRRRGQEGPSRDFNPSSNSSTSSSTRAAVSTQSQSQSQPIGSTPPLLVLPGQTRSVRAIPNEGCPFESWPLYFPSTRELNTTQFRFYFYFYF